MNRHSLLKEHFIMLGRNVLLSNGVSEPKSSAMLANRRSRGEASWGWLRSIWYGSILGEGGRADETTRLCVE
jgi:hypothetical protein